MSRARILLMASPGALRAELASLLELQGHDAVTCDSTEALREALARGPALAVLALEREQDLARARILRALAPELPLLGLTAGLDRAARLRCLNAGLDDLAALPLDPLELRVRVRGMLAAREGRELQRALLLREDRSHTLRTLGAGLTHDLANLAVRLQCVASDLRDAGASADPLDAAVQALGAQVRRFGELVVDAARGTAEPLEVASELRQTLAKLVAAGPLRHVELVVRDRSGGACALAPREHLAQLVANLVSTSLEALAHVPPDERAVSLDVELHGSELCLRATALRPWTVDAQPLHPPRRLGLGLPAIEALAAACGGRAELARSSAAVFLPRFDAEERAPLPHAATA